MTSNIDEVEKIADRIRSVRFKCADENYQMKTNAIVRRLIDAVPDSERWNFLLNEFGEASKEHLRTVVKTHMQLDEHLFEEALKKGDKEAVEYENSLE